MSRFSLIPLYNTFAEEHRCSLVALLLNGEFRGPFMEEARRIVGPLPERRIAEMLLRLYKLRMIR